MKEKRYTITSCVLRDSRGLETSREKNPWITSAIYWNRIRIVNLFKWSLFKVHSKWIIYLIKRPTNCRIINKHQPGRRPRGEKVAEGGCWLISLTHQGEEVIGATSNPHQVRNRLPLEVRKKYRVTTLSRPHPTTSRKLPGKKLELPDRSKQSTLTCRAPMPDGHLHLLSFI
jgi:hypothetical protein